MRAAADMVVAATGAAAKEAAAQGFGLVSGSGSG